MAKKEHSYLHPKDKGSSPAFSRGEIRAKRTFTSLSKGQRFESSCSRWQQQRENGKKECSPYHPMVKGSISAAAAGSRREKMTKNNTPFIIPRSSWFESSCPSIETGG
jgi:hypothetical protein